MKELFSEEHSDKEDRIKLLCVPIEPKTNEDKAKIYRLQQWFHMLRNYSQILEAEGGCQGNFGTVVDP